MRCFFGITTFVLRGVFHFCTKGTETKWNEKEQSCRNMGPVMYAVGSVKGQGGVLIH